MEKHAPLFNTGYLQSLWAKDFEKFKDSSVDNVLYTRLNNWAKKDWQRETASEASFIDLFFKQTWGYFSSGERDKQDGFTVQQQYPVKRAGQKGGTGKADLALGYFGRIDMDDIPQILVEFKDDRSGLDKPQINRPNDRSPVDQCLDYLRESRTGLISTVLPTWGLVTDMNEFRLYCYGNKAQYQRFVIKPVASDLAISLIANTKEASFQRFLFYRSFHSEWLLTLSGKSKLEKLLDEQIIQEQELEKQFYQEYHAFREEIYRSLRLLNQQYQKEGRLWRLVKYTQRILDRCLFILYCEDMGRELNFPPNILRDVLIEVSNSNFYNPDAEDAWTRVKSLFDSMRNGTPFGFERINRFNGGLFDEDQEMSALKLPNKIFCENNQGQSQKRLIEYPKTLLYFASKYNFGTSDAGKGKTLTLTAMGRIFEQSITDLEVMEAHADDRTSLAELTKRKRDGVYYTPEWVTHYIVEETVGARLAEIRKELGFDSFTDVTDEQIKEFIKDRRKSRVVSKYEQALHEYSERLDKLKVVDPACGSGAFLIQAFIYLYEQRQWVAKELERVTGGYMGLFDIHDNMRSVLSNNLYGVDINAESVEITRLALWLYTALPDRPLTSLDRNIRCGNSLIGHDFYSQMDINRDLCAEDENERINTFEWNECFSEVFKCDDPGFDCVIGNPPYVTYKHFLNIHKDESKYLLTATKKDGSPLFQSTQNGTFDLYLPFIERGIDLLNANGKMGFIAPSLWLNSEYGKELRNKIYKYRHLERWIDFKDFQVFRDATIYTALQFFSCAKKNGFKFYFAPDGDISAVDWQLENEIINYDEISADGVWTLSSKSERELLTSINARHIKLGGIPDLSVGFRGIETGADIFYQFKRISPGHYRPIKNLNPNRTHEFEDKIMKPLVSGPEASRYIKPITDTYVIFPYEIIENIAQLYSVDQLEKSFPNTWKYFKENEKALKARDKGKMQDKAGWYGYTRPMNLEKMNKPKLGVAETVTRLAVFYDSEGEFATNNVRVGGILANGHIESWFLQGILNAPVCNFVFKRIAKPKEGGYFEANKQFLLPLPIPKANDEDKLLVARNAEVLQSLHSKKRDFIIDIDKRLESTQCEDDIRDEEWLWADVKHVNAFKKKAPLGLKGRELTNWAKSQRQMKLALHLESLDPMLRSSTSLRVVEQCGELKILAEDSPLIEGIFLSKVEASFIAAQWRQRLRRTNVKKFRSKNFMGLLLKLRKTDNLAIKEQVVTFDSDVQILEKEIEQLEETMNQLIYRLYKLTDEEIKLVEEDINKS